jgi:ABC-type sugar transport system ATPase subunit
MVEPAAGKGMRALSASGLTKQFGETLALDHVDLSLDFGKDTGLVGENGAGKSTLLNILSGIAAPDAGSLAIRDQSIVLRDYSRAQTPGIARVFQEQALEPVICASATAHRSRGDDHSHIVSGTPSREPFCPRDT